MPMFEETAVEIAPMATGLYLKLRAEFFEDERAEVAAPNIVYASETYFVKVDWWFEGNLDLTRHLCGQWRVKIDLESIGVAKEYTSEVVVLDMEPCEKGWESNPYTHTFRLTPGDVKPHPDGTVYLVAVTLATRDACGEAGHIWGYAKGASVMFVEAEPHH